MQSKKIVRILLLALFSFFWMESSAQKKTTFEPKQGYLIDIQYSIQQPKADLADRFGWNSAIGVGGRFKFESGWVVGVQYHWMFGNQVKEVTMFDSILGSTGEIIDKDGLFSVVRLNERGHVMTFGGGRLFPLTKSNRNSGIYIEGGFGFMLHRIDIFASTLNVPQITGDYEKGYDRLCGGAAFSEFIGYQHLDPKKRVNVQLGFSFTQAFTKSMRTVDFDTRVYNDTKRLDMLQGLRIGISLPLYTKRLDEEEFFID